MGAWLGIAGWLAAAAALVASALARRVRTRRLMAVAEACHELRGPLAAVTLGLELSRRQESLPAARLRAIQLELERAALALDDLEAARRRCRTTLGSDATFDAGELLADSVEAWRPAAERRGVDLRLRRPVQAARVRGDRLRLAQATGNLIGNAIKHGGGRVLVTGCAGEDAIHIEVQDRGPGLTAPLADLIRRSAPGSRHGHGLRIANAIATAHGGRLATAPAERGARLVLELPLAPRPGPGR